MPALQNVVYSVRDRVHDQPHLLRYAAAGGGVILLLLVVALAYGLSGGGGGEPRRPPPQVWFYDLNSQTFFAVDEGTPSPVETPTGPTPLGSPAGVLAHLYACGGCELTDERFGYFEATKPLEEGGEPVPIYRPYRLGLASFRDGEWFRGQEVFDAIQEAIWSAGRCGDRKPSYCTPETATP